MSRFLDASPVVPVDGCEGVAVRMMSAADALSLSKFEDDTEATLALIHRTACDPDTREPLFASPEEVAEQLPLPMIQAISNAALRHNGLLEGNG